jgi:hypothetical protein
LTSTAKQSNHRRKERTHINASSHGRLMKVPPAMRFRSIHKGKSSSILFAKYSISECAGCVPNALQRRGSERDQPSDIPYLRCVAFSKRGINPALLHRSPFGCHVVRKCSTSRGKDEVANATLGEPTASEESKSARATSYYLSAIARWLTGSNAHDNLAQVQAILHRAEGQFMLNLHIEAIERQTVHWTWSCACRQKSKHAVDPSGIHRFVRVQSNGAVRGG